MFNHPVLYRIHIKSRPCCAVSATAFLTASATASWADSWAALAPASSPASAPACSAAPTVSASMTSASAALTASSSLSILTGAMFSLVSSAWISSADTLGVGTEIQYRDRLKSFF